MPLYVFENESTGEQVEIFRKLGDTKPPRGYIRVFGTGILSKPGGKVGKFKKHRSRPI